MNEPSDIHELAGKPLPKLKRPRATPHRWSRFFYLKRNEPFFIGTTTYWKTGPIGCAAADGSICIIAPWKKVRTMRHVSDKTEFAEGKSQGEHGFSPRTADHENQP